MRVHPPARDEVAWLVGGVIASCIAIAAFAVSPRASVLAAMAVLAAAVFMARRSWLLAAVAASVPLEGAAEAGSNLTAARLLAVLALGLLTLDVVRKRRKYFAPKLPLLLLVLFVSFAWASVGWALAPEVAVHRAFQFTQLALLYVVVSSSRRNELVAIQWGFVLGALSAVVMGFITPGAEGRFTGGGLDTNDFAATVAVALCIALGLSGSRGAGRRLVLAAFGTLGLIAVVMSGSRGGALACLPFAVMLAIRTFRVPGGARTTPGFKAAIMGLCLGGTILATVLVPATALARFEQWTPESSGGFTDRATIWSYAWRLFGEHPISGVGAGNFPTSIARQGIRGLPREGIVAHDSYLSVATELGTVGLMLFVGFIVAHFGLVRRRVVEAGRGLRAGPCAALAAICIASLSLSWEYRKTLFIVCGMIAALHHELREDLRAVDRGGSAAAPLPDVHVDA